MMAFRCGGSSDFLVLPLDRYEHLSFATLTVLQAGNGGHISQIDRVFSSNISFQGGSRTIKWH
jgi:hypothetical protein